jgi:hypothetical protein
MKKTKSNEKSNNPLDMKPQRSGIGKYILSNVL